MGIFLIATASRPAMGPTQYPFEWEPGALYRGKGDRGVELITPLHMVPRLRIRGAILPFPNTSSWRGA
jgi:hypothetical protein